MVTFTLFLLFNHHYSLITPFFVSQLDGTNEAEVTHFSSSSSVLNA